MAKPKQKTPEVVTVRSLGPIKEATVELGDLTLLVGPQGVGKSLFLQAFKLAKDINAIKSDLAAYSIVEYSPKEFADIYFGLGYKSAISPDASISIAGAGSARVHNTLAELAKKRSDSRSEHNVFYIPAQRVFVLKNGVVRPFSDYEVTDPFVLKLFSQNLHQTLSREGVLFPKEGIFPESIRSRIASSIYGSLSLAVQRINYQQQLVLTNPAGKMALSFMSWSAGQREFAPLLLSLIHLLPSGRIPKRECEYIIIEEPEMGLHPQAIEAFFLLVLVLLDRGYKVIISTHAYSLLEIVWTVQKIKELQGNGQHLMRVFGFKDSREGSGITWKACLGKQIRKQIRVFFFHRVESTQEVYARDISTLDLGEAAAEGREWGFVLSFSERANAIIAELAHEKEVHE